MKTRVKMSLVLAAISAVSIGSAAMADDLIWDIAGAIPPANLDGSGGWDLSSYSWYSGLLGTNVAWTNGSNATFGTATSGANGSTVQIADIADNIIVNNMTFNVASDGSVYNLADDNGGSLTLLGNVTKNADNGSIGIQLGQGLTLGAGTHTFSLHDTPGDSAPEMHIDLTIQGSGGITLDNSAGGFQTWGSLAFLSDNTYTGPTVINNGRLIIVTNNGLGASSSTTTIGPAGTLSIGGGGTSTIYGSAGTITIPQAITITRNTYSGDLPNDSGGYGHYGYAIIAQNGSGTVVFTGAFVVDSTDARICSNTSLLRIPGNITQGPDVTNGVLSVTGDFAGYVELDGDNTALKGGINILSAVELIAASQNSLGGASSSLSFTGGGTLQVTNALMQDFGTHVVNFSSFNGGIDVLNPTDVFTINQNLTGTSLGKRGLGTLNIGGTNNLTVGGGQTYWDSGTVNVTGNTTLASLHLRSPVVNITGSITTVNGYDSFGADSTGTNGGPDMAVINISGNGSLTEASGDDFNISDNRNTAGTINIRDNGSLTTGGITWLGKSGGAVGTINQYGGTVTINRNGNFGLVLGDGRFSSGSPTGYYNISGGTLNSAGETYLGEGNNSGQPGVGHWTQTGGNVTISNWVVFGREGGYGTMDMSGGTFTETGGNFSLGESGYANTMTLHGTAQVSQLGGEFWVGNGGGNSGTLTMTDNASLVVTNWFPVGRGGATGTVDISGNATITKPASGANNSYIGESGNQNSVMNVHGNAVVQINSGEFWLGNSGGSRGTLNLYENGSFAVTSNWLAVGRNGGASGLITIADTATLTKSGGGNFTIGSGAAVGTVTQTGGTINVIQGDTYVGETGTGIMQLSGGTASFQNLYVGFTGGSVGTMTVSGTSSVTANAVIIGGSNSASGNLTVSGGSVTTGNVTIGIQDSAGGSLTVSGGAVTAASIATGTSNGPAAVNFNGGTLSVGNFAVGGGLSNVGTGTLAPGGAGVVGTTSIVGGYVQGTTATLAIDIAGDASYDAITASASSIINGSISITDLGSYVPGGGKSFNVITLTGGILTGTPTLTGPAASLFTASIIGGDILQLRTEGPFVGDIQGDLNGDGTVNFSDLGILLANYGNTDSGGLSGYMLGDINDDGVVNFSDLGLLLANYGDVYSPGASPSFRGGAVPEPSSLAVMAVGLAALGRRRRD